ncbi:MAG: response regulator [Rhodospirillales bacterium]|nr:response regulator [Rhodospirillales bacterium]
MLEKIDPRARSLVRLMLVEPDAQLRSNLRQILIGAGFKNLQDCGSIENLEEDFENNPPDLLFIDAHTPGGDACDLVHRLRFSVQSRNPFLSVILTVWQSKATDISRLINSGADHIVLKPVAPQTIFARIEALLAQRKPFVATSRYIGPDRRKDGRSDGRIPHFEVPNSLLQKVTNLHLDQAKLQHEIDQALSLINLEMTRRLAFHLAFEAKHLADAAPANQGEAAQAFESFQLTLFEFQRRQEKGGSDDIFKTARAIGEICAKASPGLPEGKDLALLLKLSLAINLGVRSDLSSDGLFREVNAALEKHRLLN